MPTKEQLENTKLNTNAQYTWEDSRDFKDFDFLSYITPSFYRMDATAITSFLSWDILRINNELIAFNEPELMTALEIPPSALVSPTMPIGIYKRNAIATLYFWIDGNQITQRYQLQSLSRQSVATLSEQTQKAIFNKFMGKFSDLARQFNILGGLDKLADLTDYLVEQVNAENVFGVWVPVGRLTQNIFTVAGDTTGESVLEGYCRLNPEDPICNQESKKSSGSNLIPWILAGTGLITGNLWLSGVGLLLKLRNSSDVEEEEKENASVDSTPQRKRNTGTIRPSRGA
tara:strand:+ start:256 stop:1116 length:861 start_codon:yes stop_codon:yes gene_type:complete